MGKSRNLGCQGTYFMILLSVGIIWFVVSVVIPYTAQSMGDSSNWRVRMFGAILVIAIVIVTIFIIYRLFVGPDKYDK